MTSILQEYRLKEKHLIGLVDVLDREDTETERHMFELAPREQSKIVFKVQGGSSTLGKRYVDSKFEVAFSSKFIL